MVFVFVMDWQEFGFTLFRVSSVQDGIYALGKTIMRSTTTVKFPQPLSLDCMLNPSCFRRRYGGDRDPRRCVWWWGGGWGGGEGAEGMGGGGDT